MKFFHEVSVTPTLSVGAYSANDQVGGLQTITVPNCHLGVAKLSHLSILDKDGQNAALIGFVFESSPTLVSSDNAAFDLSDANMAFCKGLFTIAATDYQTSASNSVASKVFTDGAVHLRSKKDDTVYVVLKTSGTPSYTTTSGLVLTYVWEVDYNG